MGAYLKIKVRNKKIICILPHFSVFYIKWLQKMLLTEGDKDTLTLKQMELEICQITKNTS